jgi:KEOPS complex subunit Cgi121
MDEVLRATEGLAAWVVRVQRGTAGQWLERWSKEDKGRTPSLVLRKDMVFGLDHLRSALYHALLSIRNGTNVSSTLVMECLLYASGERQLQSAIRKMSVNGDTEEIVIASLSGEVPTPEPDWLPLERIETDISSERLRAFGIGEAEVKTVGGIRAAELVLERVAAVDIIKR